MTTPIYRLLPILVAWWEFADVGWTSGFEQYLSCGAGDGRYGRQYEDNADVPCDLSKDSFCLTPGSTYPWSAVRRFVKDNQGLMKRMYGSQRHYSVLRAELLHEMHEEMFDEMPKRQMHRFRPPDRHSHSVSSRTARHQKPTDANLIQHRRWKDSGSNRLRGSERSRSVKVVSMEPSEYYAKKDQASFLTLTAMMKAWKKTPGSRFKGPLGVPDSSESDAPLGDSESIKSPVDTSTSEASATSESIKSPVDISTSEASTTVGKTTKASTRHPETTQIASTRLGSTTTPLDQPTTTDRSLWSAEKERPVETTTTASEGLTLPDTEDQRETLRSTDYPPIVSEIDLIDKDQWTTIDNQFFDTASTTSYPPDLYEGTFSAITQEMFTQNPETSYPLESTTDKSYEGTDEFTTFSNTDGTTTYGTPSQVFDEDGQEVVTEENAFFKSESEPDFKNTSSESKPKIVLDEQPENTPTHYSQNAGAADEDLEVERRENPPITITEGNIEPMGANKEDNKEDSKVVETSEPPKMKIPMFGVNACPVEEVFVAPYWANNTRGETLALLNIYPFEQYVQYERCLYENRQMYCRRGCRCEQQFRLHKLLAFDPTNECRGIFSDWFRFPSCCVCKCYDLPEELSFPTHRRPKHHFEKDDILDILDDEDDELYFPDYDEDADLDFLSLDENEGLYGYDFDDDISIGGHDINVFDYDDGEEEDTFNENMNVEGRELGNLNDWLEEEEDSSREENDYQDEKDAHDSTGIDDDSIGVPGMNFEGGSNHDRVQDSNKRKSGAFRHRYIIRSGNRMINIRPQRRPRLPPRPSSHVTNPRAMASLLHNSKSTSAKDPSASRYTTPPGPPPLQEASTLGTVDAATPHYYYYNLSHYNSSNPRSRPFPLSRIPRSNPEM